MKAPSNVSTDVTDVFVYIPTDTKLNFSNTSMDTPEPKYNNRRKIFDQDAVKKIVGGIYGRNGQ